ncbi:DUF4124 domain-containing protein [Thioalkalivibrio sp. ALMg13-2]|uniref:DUF4124 domain-containing protein n=1 Tax=Thioalkalivibrio sp. ALMg13-2 TaxID=1158167 RepID=UPI0035109F85
MVSTGEARDIYRCTDADGGTTLSDRPCAGTPSGTLRLNPDANVLDGSNERRLRAEQDLRERLEERERRAATQRGPTGRTVGNECSSMEILDYSTYEREKLEGGFVTGNVDPGGFVSGTVSGGEVRKNRCVRVQFRLKGQGGRINNQRYMRELASNFVAVFSNGVRREGQRAQVATPGRIHFGEPHSGRVCFGVSDFEITDLVCK